MQWVGLAQDTLPSPAPLARIGPKTLAQVVPLNVSISGRWYSDPGNEPPTATQLDAPVHVTPRSQSEYPPPPRVAPLTMVQPLANAAPP
jgi:hypothetical protein